MLLHPIRTGVRSCLLLHPITNGTDDRTRDQACCCIFFERVTLIISFDDGRISLFNIYVSNSLLPFYYTLLLYYYISYQSILLLILFSLFTNTVSSLLFLSLRTIVSSFIGPLSLSSFFFYYHLFPLFSPLFKIIHHTIYSNLILN